MLRQHAAKLHSIQTRRIYALDKKEPEIPSSSGVIQAGHKEKETIIIFEVISEASENNDDDELFKWIRGSPNPIPDLSLDDILNLDETMPTTEDVSQVSRTDLAFIIRFANANAMKLPFAAFLKDGRSILPSYPPWV